MAAMALLNTINVFHPVIELNTTSKIPQQTHAQ